ncbi:MAG: ABC transporter ATP-binding protein [Bacteroidota bacterium]|nr:ABC transporter ATP-binding protein [Bacteroidota bacterium]
MSLLTVSGLSKQYQQQFVVKEFSFSLDKGDKLAITGETGSGKSTLLKMIAGLIQPDKGNVYFEDIRVKGPLEQLLPGHPSIAFLSQHFELRNNYRMEELLEMANKLPAEEAATLFALCRIDHLLQRKNDELSGGEKQRVALARLLIGKPSLLLLDEPYSNMDPLHQQILEEVLMQLQDRLQLTIILTSHEPRDTLVWADRILVMKKGGLIESGKPEQIYHSPGSAYTAGLFGPFQVLFPYETEQLGAAIPEALRGKKLLIRPEQWQRGNGVSGEIVATRFRGAFSEITLQIGDLRIQMLCMDTRLPTGEKMSITLKTAQVCQW